MQHRSIHQVYQDFYWIWQLNFDSCLLGDWQKKEAGAGIKKSVCSYIIMQSSPTFQSLVWYLNRIVYVIDKYDSENWGENKIVLSSHGIMVNLWCEYVTRLQR